MKEEHCDTSQTKLIIKRKNNMLQKNYTNSDLILKTTY